MVRKIFIGLIITGFILLSFWLSAYFYNKSVSDPIIHKTEKAFYTDIVKKTVATGSIVPRREVQIKPQASGIVEALYVQAGEPVKAGQLIAKVRLVQSISGKNNDMINSNNSKNMLDNATINLKNAQIEHDRQKKLFDEKVISEQEYNRNLVDLNLRKEGVRTAEENMLLINRGILQNSGGIANEIYSTVEGTILDVPVKVGSSVVERNNFNEGTTIAIVADMNSLVFEGKIDESEVGKLKEGMNLKLNIGAIADKSFPAQLEYISPKGIEKEGAIKFDIRAKLQLESGDKLRAGYSASADIVLDNKKKILAIKESMLQFGKGEKGKDSVFVEIETSKNKFAKKLIKTGISDGLNIEILSGVTEKDKIKIPAEQKDKDKKNN
ncbi:MAG: efflux RND transporter periplasmic adaptor subunit [Cytophagia bacterium]|nr:MAG: efflux RND transporter periplasmic adaptor subunit [Cytophagia bacterium]TAG46254.1 MAG: efflux RND transporter periplasmic adaptor subunit [Cytophagia bacterium]